MSRTGRLGVFFSLLGVVIGLCVFVSMAYLRTNPPVVDFTAGHQAGEPIDLTVQTVGAIGFGEHPTWVSYLVKAPDGQWVHSTLWNLPAHTKINMTILQYDSGSPLRNQEIGEIYGTGSSTPYAGVGSDVHANPSSLATLTGATINGSR